MASSTSMFHAHQHGLQWWQCRSKTFTWTWGIDTNWGSSINNRHTSTPRGRSKDHSYQHGLRGLRGRSSVEPGGLSRSPNLCLSYPATAQSQSNQASGQYIQGLSLHKLLAAAHYPAGLSQREHTPQSIAAFSYTCDHHRISSSTSLHCAHSTPSFPPLHGLFVCQSGIANCSVSAMCHRVYVPTTPQTASQANSPSSTSPAGIMVPTPSVLIPVLLSSPWITPLLLPALPSQVQWTTDVAVTPGMLGTLGMPSTDDNCPLPTYNG